MLENSIFLKNFKVTNNVSISTKLFTYFFFAFSKFGRDFQIVINFKILFPKLKNVRVFKIYSHVQILISKFRKCCIFKKIFGIFKYLFPRSNFVLDFEILFSKFKNVQNFQIFFPMFNCCSKFKKYSDIFKISSCLSIFFADSIFC